MARDAIARQFDVDKNRMIYQCASDKGEYRPGTITFHAKDGKSINLDKMRETIAATRLSGGTNMGMDYLIITAAGTVTFEGNEAMLKVAGTGQQFVLKDESPKGEASPSQRLRDAIASGAKVVSVTGRVDGWSGKFPAVLRALAMRPATAPTVLFVTEFETIKK